MLRKFTQLQCFVLNKPSPQNKQLSYEVITVMELDMLKTAFTVSKIINSQINFG